MRRPPPIPPGRGVIPLKGLVEKQYKGRLYRYLRVRGKNVAKLPADVPLDHPTFLAAYAAAVRAASASEGAAPPRGRPGPGSISEMVNAGLRSPRRRTYSEGYARMLERHLCQIDDVWGAAAVGTLADHHIRQDVAAAESPQDRLKAWRYACALAMDLGLLNSDPSVGVRPPRKARTTGHPPWTADDKAKFRKRWAIGTAARAAMEVLNWTGLRLGDAVKIGPGHVDRSGMLVYTQSKVGQPAYVPWTAPLPTYAADLAAERDMMHEALRALNRRQMTFLATEGGAPRSDKALGNMIREAAREAGIDRSAHGLRKTRGIELAEGGASAHAIMSWGGWQTLKEAEHYCRLASRRRAVMGTEQDRNAGKSPRDVGKDA